MPLVSVPAIYDGQQVWLLEAAPVHGPYRVLVTFVEPEPNEVEASNHPQKFEELKGIWRGIDLSLEDIQTAEYKVPQDLL